MTTTRRAATVAALLLVVASAGFLFLRRGPSDAPQFAGPDTTAATTTATTAPATATTAVPTGTEHQADGDASPTITSLAGDVGSVRVSGLAAETEPEVLPGPPNLTVTQSVEVFDYTDISWGVPVVFGRITHSKIGAPFTGVDLELTLDGYLSPVRWEDADTRDFKLYSPYGDDMRYRVRHVNAAGAGPWSRIYAVNTPTWSGPVRDLHFPTYDSVTDRYAVRWDPPTDTGGRPIIGYVCVGLEDDLAGRGAVVDLLIAARRPYLFFSTPEKPRIPNGTKDYLNAIHVLREENADTGLFNTRVRDISGSAVPDGLWAVIVIAITDIGPGQPTVTYIEAP